MAKSTDKEETIIEEKAIKEVAVKKEVAPKEAAPKVVADKKEAAPKKVADKKEAAPKEAVVKKEAAPKVVADKKEAAPKVFAPKATKAVRTKIKAGPNASFVWGTGRRKNAIARVRICDGDGKFLVNNREVKEYLPRDYWASQAVEALAVAGVAGKIDVFVNAHGGGLTGQAGAIRLGVARAIIKMYPNTRPLLKKAGLLTRDSRMVERQKVGMKGARASKQFSKR
jgi:small subunit ribosomal protein S9